MDLLPAGQDAQVSSSWKQDGHLVLCSERISVHTTGDTEPLQVLEREEAGDAGVESGGGSSALQVDPLVFNMIHEDPGNPCIIFMDEIDAIGGRRFSEGTSADREIQRTLMELLNQLDGFDELGKVKVIMATNRPDVLDPALLRPGRLDRKIEIPLPNEPARVEILKIHAAGMAKHGEIDYEAAAKLAEGFNAADIRNVCTEAGMAAIRAERDYAVDEDFMKGVRKIADAKKLESSADYKADFGKD